MPGAERLFWLRDTDADWRELGANQPYWGVLSRPDFRSENITSKGVQDFYATGRADIDFIVEQISRATGAKPSGRALDFGCGVGRLAEAMTSYASHVTGYDISPGMLELARKRASKVAYLSEIPAGPFDWINSYIVFQHIEPQRGIEILDDLLSRLAPGGVVSLQFTIWREAGLEVPSFKGWKAKAQLLRHRFRLKHQPAGQISMYDYDLSQIVRVLNGAGVEEMQLLSTDHGGHHGVIILGRKTINPSHA